MHLAHTVSDLHTALHDRRAAGGTHIDEARCARRVALVPTMGNLHAGHVRLVRRARELAECVVVSIFVNPLQFGAGEDYEHYPRTLDADLALIEGEGVQVVFAPKVADVYPGGYPPATKIEVSGGLSDILCGAYRPGHFTGVATVVNILFNLVRPDIAVFGEKDYQQLAVIRRMAGDLGMPVRIVGIETMRELDGLAMSSRNRYLSADERRRAPELHATLQNVASALTAGRRDFAALQAQALERLQAAGFRPQYVEIRAPDLKEPAAQDHHFVVLAAAYLGETRLIDNVAVRA